MTALTRKLFRDLVHLRGQMIAVAVVVACGIATYVSMVSVYDSLLVTRATYYDRYRFAEIFASVKRAPEGLMRDVSAIPGVSVAQSRIVMDVTVDVPELDEPATGRLISLPDRRVPILNDLHIRSGGYIEPGRSDQVIISEAFSEANTLAVGDSLGAVINGRWRTLRIVGIALSPEYVYEFGGASIFPDNKRFGLLWMSREALSAAFDMEGAFNSLSLALIANAQEEDVVDRLDHILERYGGLGAITRDEQVSHRFLDDELTSLRVNALITPMIFLGVAAFLLHIVLSRLVGTQRDQVAVLKAFGYGNVTIGIHYMLFALVGVLVGAVIGTGLGVWFGSALTEVYQQFYRFPILRYNAGVEVVTYAILISGGSAMIGALGAVRRAVGLPPAEAMRPEPPARFKPGLLERIGLQQLFSASWRMIFRNVERNPWKAFISILGISLSVAILILGRFSFDSIGFLNDLQFRTVQREDLSVVFNAPRPASARYDLPHLPGVIRAETYRMVPARVRYEHRTRQLALQGIDPDGELRRIIDDELNVYSLPPDGVVLTAKLGEVLGIGVGDTLTVEVLEGARPTKRVIVTDLVDEMIGLSVYMDINSLNSMMGEGGTISGAYLTIDSRERERLYEYLKRTPAVAGAIVREATLESFEKTIAESQGISSSALIIFASVIAIGIVYNSARIALSERGRELASLRVLGFTKGEITVILLGEQAILILAAIPLGVLLGYMMAGGLVTALSNEMYRIPFRINPDTFVVAALTVIAAGVFSGLLVRRRLRKLDLIEVLKTRE